MAEMPSEQDKCSDAEFEILCQHDREGAWWAILDTASE
jgi:hypothetical protein